MNEEAISLLARFRSVEEVIQTLLVSNDDADYRQEAVTVPAIYQNSKPQEMLVWRDL